jgi:hypothetical protein
MNRTLIYDFLRFALSDGMSGCDGMRGASVNEWKWVFSTLSMHGLAAYVYDAVERMPEDVRPPKEVLLKFISANMACTQSYGKLKGLSAKIDQVVRDAGVKCLLLKGLSLAEYYPRPEARKFLDIDLYAPGAEARVDEAFAAKGVEIDTDFYRHSHMTLGGILVENHHCLLDVRGRKRLAELDADLKAMALVHLASFDGPGLYFPDARFSLIFNLHHAMSHFVYEGISFKFLVDWIYFLRRERELLSTDQTASSLRTHGLMKFAGVMSAVSVNHLGLSVDDVPECIRMEMSTLKPEVVDRFVDDLFRPYEQIHQKNIIAERLHSVRRIIKAAWKPKEFLGQSAVGFVWDKFLPILLGKKFEAD